MNYLKNSKKRILTTLIFLIGINVLVDLGFYLNYKEQIKTLSIVAESSGQEGIDIVMKILKEHSENTAEGTAILKQYGYLDSFHNKFYWDFVVKCVTGAFITVLVIIAWHINLKLRLRYVKREEYEMLKHVEQSLINFRNGTTDIVSNVGQNELMERLNYQLRLLGEHLDWVREQAAIEKQETKGIVSDISHQLKTPVAALDTCFTILSDSDLSNEERSEFMERCRSELNGLENLLQSLIQISRMEAGMIQIEKKSSLLLDTMVMAVNRIYPKASEKNIEIIFEYDKRIEKLEVLQDKRWLAEAFINLLDNAIKYSREKSEVKVALYERTNFVRIEIKDQGVGIPKEEYHKVFQRFYRGRLKEIKNSSGSGIGLYLVRDIIQRHDGTVSVSSMYGKTSESNPGSTFVIQLPIDKKSLTKV